MTIEVSNQAIAEAKKIIKGVIAIEPESLTKHGQEINFEESLSVFKGINNLFKDLNDSDLNNLPPQKLNDIRNIGSQIIGLLNKIKEFSIINLPTNSNVIQERDNLTREIDQLFSNYFDRLAAIAVFGRKTDDKKILTLTKNLEKQIKESEEIIKKSKNSLEIIESMAAKAGVTQHSKYFKLQAEEHSRIANIWLIITILVVLVTIYYACITLNIIENIQPNKALQIGIARLAIFAVFYYSIIWCSKTYRAHRHNYIVSKHRQNALSSFESFAEATGSDQDTKNAVLLQATQCIFSHQQSGYLTNEPDPSPSPQIVEILKGMTAPRS